MIHSLRRLCLVVAASALVAGAAFGGDGQLPSGAIEALKWSTPLIDAARNAPATESSDVAKGIRRAVDWMQPFLKSGSANPEWATAWNEALTLTKFHRNKPTGEYALEPQTAVGGYVEFGIPVGRNWTFSPKTPGSNEQSWGTLEHTMLDGRRAATVTISEYRFNVVYSGIGGENATALAKRHLDDVKSLFTKVDSSSKQVSARPLSKSFTRTQYVEAEGTTEKSGRLRARTYFAKVSTRTYAFHVFQYLDTIPTDTPCEAWQKGGEDPELAAVLASIEEGDPQKRKK